MLRPLRSFRVKLILYFTAVFGMIQIALSLTGLALRERHVRDMYDHQVIERLELIREQLADLGGPVTSAALDSIISNLPRSTYYRDYFVTVRTLDGQVLARTADLGEQDLPYDESIRSELLRKAYDARVLGPDALRPALDRGSFRLVSQRAPNHGDGPLVFQIATSFEQVERSIQSLYRFFFSALTLGLLAAAATSWVVTARISQRIDRVAELARQLTPNDLSRRLAEPQADDEVAELVRQINTMLDRLETGFRAQERFIHDASHELKTPLAAILTEAQVMKMAPPSPDDARAFLDSVINELMHMSRLIESLLLLAGDNRQESQDSFESCDVNDLVVDAVRRCQPLAQEYGVTVHITALDAEDTCESRTVHCDRELIIILVSNLVRNAIRFTPRGGQIRVETHGDGPDARVTVADEGPGINPDDLPHVFERFYQGKHKLSRRGTGLGLAIVHTITQLHGGRIQVTNRTDRTGAVFTLHLPRHTDPADA